MYNIGEKIRFSRKKQKITQQSLSCKILNRVTLSNIENNKQEPSISQLIYICKKLNINTYELIGECYQLTLPTIHNNLDCVESMFSNKNYYDITKYYELNRLQFNSISGYKKFYYLGMSYFNIDVPINSKRHLRKFMNLYLRYDKDVQLKEVVRFCDCLNTLFKIDFCRDPYSATDYLELAITFIIKYKIEDSRIALSILNNLCVSYLQSKSYKKIIDKCRYLHSIESEICYPKIYINIFKSLAIAYTNLEKYEQSIHYSKKVIALYSYLDDSIAEGYAYINYINSHRHNSQLPEALNLVHWCKDKYKSHKVLYNIFLSEECNIHLNMKNYRQALITLSVVKRSDLSTHGKISLDFIHLWAEYKCNINMYDPSKAIKIEKFFINNCINYDLFALYTYLYKMTDNDSYLEKRQQIDLSRNEKNVLISLTEAESYL